MKRFMYLSLSAILSISSICGINVPTYASIQDVVINNEQDNDIRVKDITYEEYISSLAKSKNITYDEAVMFDLEQNKEFYTKYGLEKKDYYYKQVSKTFPYPGNPNFKADLEATIKMSGEYIYYQIDGCSGVWTRPTAGIYNYEWVENYSNYEGDFPGASIDILGSGYFKITQSNSVSGGISVPGFSVSGSVGSTTILTSESLNMRFTYDVRN